MSARKEDLCKNDRREWERFALYCRAIYQAEQAGVPGDEAARAIYPDHYHDAPDAEIMTCNR